MLSQEYLYTVEPIKKKVSNDFELANRWPYGIVASTWAYSDDPDGIIEAANRRKLESLGYKVSAGSQYNESYFTISW